METIKQPLIFLFFFTSLELNLLRNVDANNSESDAAAKSSSLLSGFRGSSSYNHETEIIFALPRMQLDFKSIHVQDPQEPSLSGTATAFSFVLFSLTERVCEWHEKRFHNLDIVHLN